MNSEIPFLIYKTSHLDELCGYTEEFFLSFLEKASLDFINDINDEFDNKCNFDARLKGYLSSISNAKKIIENQSVKNDKHNIVVKKYDYVLNILKSKYHDIYKDVFLESVRISFCSNEKLDFLNDKSLGFGFIDRMSKRKNIPGNEEYFNHEKLNEVFLNYGCYMIFYDYIQLFNVKKHEFNHADGSYLYRKMFERKYIIDSVSENDFRIKVYDKINLVYSSKLKTLDSSKTTYKEIIFDFVEKQNRRQRILFSS